MVRLGLAFAAVSAFLVIAAAGGTLAPNVRGTVSTPSAVDKTPSGCFVDEPCDPPIGAVATIVSFSRVGRPAVRIRAVDGAFALHLAPAVYHIAVTPASGAVSPATVRVPRIGVVRLRLTVQPDP